MPFNCITPPQQLPIYPLGKPAVIELWVEPEKPNYLAAVLANLKLSSFQGTVAASAVTVSGSITQTNYIAFNIIPDYSIVEQFENLAEMEGRYTAPIMQMEVKPSKVQPKPVEYLASNLR